MFAHILEIRRAAVIAAMKVDMDRKTARKYRDQAKLPSELKTWPHAWRTRQDPFAEVWEEVREQLELSPGLQAKTLFEWLQRRYSGRFENGQLRTLQRRVHRWEQRPVHRRRCFSHRSIIRVGWARPTSPI